jgi:hypothetical protein
MTFRTALFLIAAPLLAQTTACSYTVLGPPFRAVVAPQDTGIIYIYRPNIMKGSAHAMSVFVDGLPVGFFFPGGYVPFHVRPGSHKVSIAVGNKTHVQTVDVEANSDSYVKYEVEFADSKLTPVPRDVGRTEVKQCNLLPGGYDARDRS